MLRLKITPTYFEEVGTIEEARREVELYIERFDLGASDYEDLGLYDEQGQYFGSFSYNGRFWPKGGED